jgi:asparagine synthase (glutamine-hydrolysing)
MCGIFTFLNTDPTFDFDSLKNSFKKGQKRGPEFSILTKHNQQIQLGFHRLAINGLNNNSNQPLKIGPITLLCNGEIYNYKTLYNKLNISPTSDSDCEVIIHCYHKYGLEQTLNLLDGEYAFVLLDDSVENCTSIYASRDPFGIRPLYQLDHPEFSLGFASEMKSLIDYKTNNMNTNITQFTPGTYSHFLLENNNFVIKSANIPYFKMPLCNSNYFTNQDSDLIQTSKNYLKTINKYLEQAVIKRVQNSERPVACLLSGGLDSSLVSALANNYIKTTGSLQKINTYSIGLKDAEDLRYARLVSQYIGTNHTEVTISENDMFDAIPTVIKSIESYDTTTVRASLGNYLIGKYIREHSTDKVILNGDGSDELFGGYIYMNKCKDDFEFDKETKRLLLNIHNFDVLRSDKSISSNGLEPRTPFLDINFVQQYLSMPISFRNHNNINQMEKYCLRRSFTNEFFTTYNKKPLLPDEILWRKKEAFSDGVSSKEKSLFEIIQDKIIEGKLCPFTKDMSKVDIEKAYYKSIYQSFYPNTMDIIPYYWMPKYSSTKDPSARTTEFYNDTYPNSNVTVRKKIDISDEEKGRILEESFEYMECV